MSKIGGRDRSDVLRLAMSRHPQPERRDMPAIAILCRAASAPFRRDANVRHHPFGDAHVAKPRGFCPFMTHLGRIAMWRKRPTRRPEGA